MDNTSGEHVPAILKVGDEGWMGQVVDYLRRDLLAILPTKRWYMFAAAASSPSGAEAIFASKNRPVTKSLLLVAPDVDYVLRTFELSEAAELLAASLWPGDFAMRLTYRQEASIASVAAGAPVALVTVANDCLGLVSRSMAEPLIATSVNRSGLPQDGGTRPSVTLDEVEQHVSADASVGVIVDGGTCPLGNALTVMDFSDLGDPFLWRPGTLDAEVVRSLLGTLDVSRAISDAPPSRADR